MPSWQRLKIGTAVAFDHFAKFRWSKHLDRFPPGVEMPGHFKKAAGAETNNEAAVRLSLDPLVGVKGEALCASRGFRCEPPNYILYLTVINIRAETTARVDADIEVGDRFESLGPQLCF